MGVYYADKTGGDDNDSGVSQSTPWKTLARIRSETFGADDWIYLKRGEIWKGEYLEINGNGTGEGDRIIVDAYGSGPKPIIDFDEMTPAVRWGGDYVLAKNLRVTGGLGYGTRIRGAYGNLDYCEIDNVGLGLGLEGEHGRARHNNIHDLKVVESGEGGGEDYGATGVVITQPYNEVSHNFFRNCVCDTVEWGLDGGVIEFNGKVDNANIHDNKAIDCFGFFEAGGGEGASAKDVALRDNIMVNCYQIGGLHLGGGYATVPDNFLFERNIVVEFTDSTHPMLWFHMGTPTPDQFKFRRNVVIAGSLNDRLFTDQAGFDHSNNYYIVNKIVDIPIDYYGEIRIGGWLQLLGFHS